MRLLAATDAHFAWMLGEPLAIEPSTLRLPPGGVDTAAVLTLLRDAAARLRIHFTGGSWMMVSNNEIVGLISYKRPPDHEGTVELGFGVAQSRRRLGYATAAIQAVVGVAASCHHVSTLAAETAAGNIASQTALARAGFTQAGVRNDSEDGTLILWRRALP